MESLLFLLPLGLMFFFMSRTQKKQQEAHLNKINSLVKGAEVITIGGLYGLVDEVIRDENKFVLDVDGVYLTFELGAVKTVLSTPEQVQSDLIVEEAEAEFPAAVEEE